MVRRRTNASLLWNLTEVPHPCLPLTREVARQSRAGGRDSKGLSPRGMRAAMGPRTTAGPLASPSGGGGRRLRRRSVGGN